MHNKESVLANKTQKILPDFQIQTDHLIPDRRPDLVLVKKKKKTCRIVDFAKNKESEKRDKY